jgi:hypothetical protein
MCLAPPRRWVSSHQHHIRYPLVMTNSSLWKPWPIDLSIIFPAFAKPPFILGIFHGELLNYQRVDLESHGV